MEVQDTKQIAGNRFLRLFERTFSHKGHSGKWLFASRDENPPEHKDKKPDAVIVVAVKTDEDRPKIVLTSEYRVPILAREISFPAGLIDAADYEGAASIQEAAKKAAIRECWEETNLTFTPMSVSPPNLYASAGMTNESAIFVMGTATGEPSNKNSEKSEDIQVIILDEQQIGLLLEGKDRFYDHALSVRAWMMLLPVIQFSGLRRLIQS